MVTRDEGPKGTLGFGVSQANLPREYESRSASSEKGALAQYFEDKPVAKFFATAIGAMVGGATAGALVRRGGIKALHRAANSENRLIDQMYSRNLRTFRKVQKTLDEYSGTHRRYLNDDPDSAPWLDEGVDHHRRTFLQSAEERRRIQDLGYEAPEMFSLRDEYQQRLIRLARRAPYELTGAYVFDQMVLHPTLGIGDDDRKVNLFNNPVDAIGDFANETAKNLAFGFLPFDAGVGTIKHTYQKNMYRAAMSNTVGGSRAIPNDLLVDVSSSLKLVGAQFGDMVSEMMRYSGKGMGSLATGITDTAQKTRGTVSMLEVMKNSGVRDMAQRIKNQEELPTVFAQLRNVASQTKQAWGDSTIGAGARAGGTSRFERYVNSIYRLAPREGVDGALQGGRFYEGISQKLYGDVLEARLVANKVDQKLAARVVRGSKFMPSSDPNVAFSRRFRFGDDDRAGAETIAERIETAFGIKNQQLTSKPYGNIKSKADVNVLEQALLESDDIFMSKKEVLDEAVQRAWNRAYKGDVSREVRSGLGFRKAAYSDFEMGALDGSKREFLVRQTARRAGLDTNNVSTAQLREQLKSLRGIDSDDYGYLRTYLIDKGDISKPWNPKGNNILGFRAVSVNEAIDEGYFDDSMRSDTIHDVARTIGRTDYESYLASQTKVGGLFRSSSGRLLDMNPAIDAARKTLSIVGNEIKVPFIQVRPLQLFGLTNWESAISKGPIRFSTQQRTSLLDVGDSSPGGVFFFQGRGARGKLSGYDFKTGEFTPMQGKYAPIDTRSSAVQSDLIKLAVGESGSTHAPLEEGAGFFRRLMHGLRGPLDIAPGQDKTIWRFFRAMKGMREPGGVSLTAKRILDPEFDLDTVSADEAKELFNFWRRGAVAPSVRRYGKKGRLAEMFGTGDEAVYDLTERQLLDKTRNLLDDQDVTQTTRRLRRDVLNRYGDMTEADLKSLTASQRRISRITTTADELRADMVRLQAIESGMANRKGGGFGAFVDDAMQELDELYSTGRITSKERAEASLSLGSMMQTYQSTVKFDKADEVLKSYRQTLQSIRSEVTTPGAGMREVLERTAARSDAGVFALMKRSFAMANDRRAINYDVFPDDVQFVQTFGSAFNRSPRRAISSVLGFQSWGPQNADSFSLATMTTSNLVTRMNRAGFGIFGAKLDETAYRGPMDLLFRGMGVKRILPAFAAGTGFMAADRTLGGMVNDRDAQGDRVYSPLIMGGLAEIGVRAQALGSGLTPGGLGYQDKLEQLTEGEVAVRSGRYWILGNTPWRGGKVDHFGPSWYRRLKSGAQYTDQLYGSPMEKLLYGHDFSPLRPFDPYRFEKRTAEERPYPQSGDYFTGPFGPITPALNATLGRVLKPRVDLNPEAMDVATSSMIPRGQYGSSPAVWQTYEDAAGTPAYESGSASAPSALRGINNRYVSAAGITGGVSGGPDSRMSFVANSAGGGGRDVGIPFPDVENYLAAAGTPAYLSGSRYASMMVQASDDPANQIYRAGQPIGAGDLGYQASEMAYRAQEFAGIYGFGFGTLRETLGLGNMDYDPSRPVTASPSDAYGFPRQFWDQTLGGLGDFPTPLEGQYANLEISELMRRFVPRPRERTFNPLPNAMGQRAPWLPGAEGLVDFKTGDPFTKITQGELRLPGKGYERIHGVSSGNYEDPMEQLRILADVAPYSPQARSAIDSFRGSPEQMAEVEMIRRQMEAQTTRYEFTEYSDSSDYLEGGPGSEAIAAGAGVMERFRHMDTYFHRKFINDQSALEHWERTFVYGSAFPEWGSPIESFAKPAAYKAGDRNPFAAAAGLGIIGTMLGATHRTKGALRTMGVVTGAGISMYQGAKEKITGERYIPEDRKREVAFEQWADTLKYVKAKRNFEIARSSGDQRGVSLYRQQMKSTMYGADIYGSTADELARALPKRKREHFMTFINEESQKKREQILSTSGVLERRIYQAAWGMKVEERPELEEYFEDKELPAAHWEGWSPQVSMDDVILKSLQHEGLNASQMGYYPQELERANHMNPSFPVFSEPTQGDPRQQLNLLLSRNGMSGSVVSRPSFGGGNRVNIVSGV